MEAIFSEYYIARDRNNERWRKREFPSLKVTLNHYLYSQMQCRVLSYKPFGILQQPRER
jgi:hypothetical protein